MGDWGTSCNWLDPRTRKTMLQALKPLKPLYETIALAALRGKKKPQNAFKKAQLEMRSMYLRNLKRCWAAAALERGKALLDSAALQLRCSFSLRSWSSVGSTKQCWHTVPVG